MRKITRISPSSATVSSEVPDKVSGIAYSYPRKTAAFFCSSTGDVGFISGGQVEYAPRRLEIPSPIGMSGNEGGIIVFQASEDLLWRFDGHLDRGMLMCSNKTLADLSGMARIGRARAPVPLCEVADGTFALAIPSSNRVLLIGAASAEPVFGSGDRGFSLSSDLRSARLDGPSGVCFDRHGGVLYVADKGNGVVRGIDMRKGVELRPIGMPGDLRQADGDVGSARFLAPSAIKMSGRKVAVLDANTVRMVDIAAGRVETTHLSPLALVDLAAGPEDVYVLEDS